MLSFKPVITEFSFSSDICLFWLFLICDEIYEPKRDLFTSSYDVIDDFIINYIEDVWNDHF